MKTYTNGIAACPSSTLSSSITSLGLFSFFYESAKDNHHRLSFLIWAALLLSQLGFSAVRRMSALHLCKACYSSGTLLVLLGIISHVAVALCFVLPFMQLMALHLCTAEDLLEFGVDFYFIFERLILWLQACTVITAMFCREAQCPPPPKKK